CKRIAGRHLVRLAPEWIPHGDAHENLKRAESRLKPFYRIIPTYVTELGIQMKNTLLDIESRSDHAAICPVMRQISYGHLVVVRIHDGRMGTNEKVTGRFITRRVVYRA